MNSGFTVCIVTLACFRFAKLLRTEIFNEDVSKLYLSHLHLIFLSLFILYRTRGVSELKCVVYLSRVKKEFLETGIVAGQFVKIVTV